MIRSRWYGLRSEISIHDFTERLKERAYNDARGDGFVLDELRSAHVEARFIEKVHRLEEAFDPFGQRETFERFEYRSQRFRLSDRWPHLELIGVSKYGRTLISRLLEITDYDFTLEPLKVDVAKWATDIQAAIGSIGRVDRVQAKNVQAGPDALAFLQVDSALDALAALKVFVKTPNVAVDKVRVRLPTTFGTFVVSAAGSIEVSGPKQLTIVEGARASLRRDQR